MQHLYTRFCAAIKGTLIRYHRFFAPEGTKRYYASLLLHALSPTQSIENLYTILFDFYVKNLDFQYIPEDVSYPCEAVKLYDASTLFRCSLAYARQLSCPIYILSAKHGLVAEDQVLAPYNECLAEQTRCEKEVWADGVLSQLNARFDLGQTQFIILAGKEYCQPLLPSLPHYRLPLRGMSLGRRISALSEWTSGKSSSVCESTQLAPESEPCLKLHRLFCGMPRYRFDQIDQIPFIDGIYIMFEAGERYHSYDRIVRVGTHTSDGRLKQRLRDHFLKENKDGSIFRKNIGKAILNKNSHPYLSIWTEDSRDRRAMHLKYGDAFDEGFQAQLEQQVSRYLRENITFTCIPVPSAEARLRYEEGIIASLHQAGDFGPGEQWRGRYSPVQAIRTSGLWLVQGLDATPLSAEEFQEIASLCGSRPVKAADSPAMASHQPAVKKEVPPGKQPGIHEVAAYLKSRIETADKSGEKYITLRSGEIHKELRLSNRMPTVCDAMYQLMKPGDTVIERPPKGRGSRLVITYQT